ncbi:NADH dehydrogenase [ubiquinone] 1 subunit C2-like [Saccoglossus kowalevskii]|uniref:NADH dehydrogenase [ubiquinone] 1 subunit C2 n=1 Tax=Saccoglossus kowalevskii TaxID=10224 RepID=A0ABM0GX96_SACKO|nr:PREDICTED: NADH dehydrogenase [ubiquinone] 1 subunit C2-like [Saccoglossus kowalevskii]
MVVPDPNPTVNTHTVAFGSFGFFSSVVNNGLTRRPPLSGLHRHAIAFVIGAALGYYYRQFERRHWAERDWYIEDYVQRHPQSFPEPEKKKMGSILHPWGPVK